MDLTEKYKLWYELGKELARARHSPTALEEDFYRACRVMTELYGDSPIRRTRERPYPCLRYIMAEHLVGLGYRTRDVGDIMGLDRTTLIHGLNNLPYLLDNKTSCIKFDFNKIMYENEI